MNWIIRGRNENPLPLNNSNRDEDWNDGHWDVSPSSPLPTTIPTLDYLSDLEIRVIILKFINTYSFTWRLHNVELLQLIRWTASL